MNEAVEKTSINEKIKKLLNNRRIMVFSICLVIATILWFLNALSKNYKTDLSCPIQYTNIPDSQGLIGVLPNKINLLVNADGYALLRYKVFSKKSAIEFNVLEIIKKNDSLTQSVVLNSPYIIDVISEQISTEINIIDVKPDKISIKLGKADSKSVVKNTIDTIKDQGQNSSQKQNNIRQPDREMKDIKSIKSKKAQLLDNTLTVELSNSEQNTQKARKQKKRKTVEKYLKKKIAISVSIKNKPNGLTVKLFPSKIEAVFVVEPDKYDSINAQHIKAWVDYKETRSNKEVLTVQIEKLSDKITNLDISPKRIEYLIEK